MTALCPRAMLSSMGSGTLSALCTLAALAALVACTRAAPDAPSAPGGSKQTGPSSLAERTAAHGDTQPLVPPEALRVAPGPVGTSVPPLSAEALEVPTHVAKACFERRVAAPAAVSCATRPQLVARLAEVLTGAADSSHQRKQQLERRYRELFEQLEALRAAARRLVEEAKAAHGELGPRRPEVRRATLKNDAAQRQLTAEFSTELEAFHREASRRRTQIEKARLLGLAELETCEGAPFGLIAALRAQLDTECGGMLLRPHIESFDPETDSDIAAALRGIYLASRVDDVRVQTAPAFVGAFSEAALARYLSQNLSIWQAKAQRQIAPLQQDVLALPVDSYGRLVAQAAVVRTLRRFVKAHRTGRIPNTMKSDYESRVRFYGAVDSVAQPINERARQLELEFVSMAERLGVLDDPAFSRSLLDDTRFGRSPVAQVLLPRLSLPPKNAPPPARLAAFLPSFYSEQLFTGAELAEPEVFEALVRKGVPSTLRRHLTGHAVTAEQARLVAHARLRLGLLYSSQRQFAWASAALSGAPQTDETELLQALASVLQSSTLSYCPLAQREECPHPEFEPAPIERAAERLASRPASVISKLAAFDHAVLSSWKGNQWHPGQVLEALAALEGTAYHFRFENSTWSIDKPSPWDEYQKPPWYQNWPWLGY